MTERLNGMKLLGNVRAYKLAFDESGRPLGVALTGGEIFSALPATMHVRVESGGVAEFDDGDEKRYLVKPSTNNPEKSLLDMKDELKVHEGMDYEGDVVLKSTRTGFDIVD